ncbi:MAG: hypothetical protein SWH78_14105 [Thermodesulfobacteriota bacterium]|nr:hypothetical protein [Thermodesulfobacteriota bacterium]
MSKYLTAKELMERWNVKHFELFHEYITKGLQPYDDMGNPRSPADVSLSIGAHIAPPVCKNWEDVELPEPTEHVREIVERTVYGSLFKKSDVDEIEKQGRTEADTKERIPDLPQGKKKPRLSVGKDRKPRPSAIHRIRVRAKAEELWLLNPEETIADMAHRDELHETYLHERKECYSEEQVQRWIRDLCPNPKRGRPKKKT